MKQYNKYNEYDSNQKREFVQEKLKSKKELFCVKNEMDDLVITYLPYNLDFVYIPEGEYDKGLSLKERQQAKRINKDVIFENDELELEKGVHVSDFLVTRTPILNSFANQHIRINYYTGEENFAAYIKKENVDFLCQKLGLRLPYEAEWEYFTRAGSTDLFAFGTELPNDDELEKWLCFDFSDLSKLNKNKFGVYGIYTGEWCGDYYKKNNCSLATDDFVIKGGGAYFWPWQSDEWIWCMSAMRMSSDGLIDGECGFRLVYDLI